MITVVKIRDKKILMARGDQKARNDHKWMLYEKVGRYLGSKDLAAVCAANMWINENREEWNILRKEQRFYAFAEVNRLGETRGRK